MVDRRKDERVRRRKRFPRLRQVPPQIADKTKISQRLSPWSSSEAASMKKKGRIWRNAKVQAQITRDI